MKPGVTLTQAISDVELLGGPFRSSTFWPWKTLAKIIDGLPLTEAREIALFEQCTGRAYNRHNRRAVRRLILLVARRGGKDRFLSGVALWRAALYADWRKHISAGEQATVLLLAADKRQASILFRYCLGLIRGSKRIAKEVSRQADGIIEFRNGAALEVTANDARLVRGRSAIALLGSECCHWKTDEQAVSNDEEVVGAAEPSMAMCSDGGMLLLASSVHRRSGYMHRKYEELFGNNDADDLCWFAPTTTMNPALPEHVIQAALKENEARAKAEYLNVWRDDKGAFVSPEAIEACTDYGTPERAPLPSSAIKYLAFVDCATGSGESSFAFAIAHRMINDKNRVVYLDCVREYKPPFVIGHVVAELAETCRRYRITEVTSDAFAAGFHNEQWALHHIKLNLSEMSASEIYLNAMPLLLAPNRVRLIDNAVLRSQFSNLEHKVFSTGREAIKATGRDDVCVSACGAVVLAARRPVYNLFAGAFATDTEPSPQATYHQREAERWRQELLEKYGQPVRMFTPSRS